MRTDRTPIAILLGDIHLSHLPPVFRSTEADWYDTQAYYLNQISGLAHRLDVTTVVCAGDIFDRPDPPPRLINLAIEHLPKGMYAIPGNHDLPNHNIDDIYNSAYGVLILAEVINDMSIQTHKEVKVTEDLYLQLWGFPFGRTIRPPSSAPEDDYNFIDLCVAHKFIWKNGEDADVKPEGGNITGIDLSKYDAAVFGDNHRGFQHIWKRKKAECSVFNCGTFMRRTSREQKYQPRMGVLYDDSSIEPYYLEVSNDQFLTDRPDNIILDAELSSHELQKLSEFLNAVGDVAASDLEFRLTVRDWMRQQNEGKLVKQIIKELMDPEHLV